MQEKTKEKAENTAEPKETKQADVVMLEEDLFMINGNKYRLIENHDNGFDREKIEERYNTVLDKYDYIVGDWGYDQLRFKGFFMDKRFESNLDNKISHLEDYLIEYCNFGCAYFILERVDKLPLTKPKRHSAHAKGNRPNNHTNSSHHNERNKNNAHKTHHVNSKQTTHGPNHKSNAKRTPNKKKPQIRKNKLAVQNNHHSSAKPAKKRTNTNSGTRTFKIRKLDKRENND
ncbi:YutD family protein [Companilactobacillus mishanensis]|uniref:DUF1027 domain-containing protein n=1 Tax=Companilactobacillus mishanensis TaxID=2486008 RepID=A0A5P0ZII0_9LACO|nr:YutD family protein [Companilactobacillus mishanensis]MQS52879.1 DUF1027 domain-containing protein [Companilactobacillus mishanensis]